MFHRYNEAARRIVFYARAYASQYPSEQIDLEHMLLGVTQVSFSTLSQLITPERAAALRREAELYATLRAEGKEVPTSIDLPLSDEAKKVLWNAVQESGQSESQPIEEKHLIAALLQQDGYVSDLMKKHGLTLKLVRNANDKGSRGDPDVGDIS